jgi:hypothetical protein
MHIVMTTRSGSIVAKALICALLTAFTATVNAQYGYQVTKSTETKVAFGVVGAGALVGVGVYFAIHHGHSLTGCTVSGSNGLQLQSQGDQQTYKLVGEIAEIKPGERIHVSGKKQKVNTAVPREFLVEKLNKDFAPCKMATDAR